MRVQDVLDNEGGIAHRSVILAEGVTSYQLGRSVHSGEIYRVRQAWYATPRADPTMVRAVRVGGAVTAASAASFYGLWAFDDDRIHVAVAANGGRLRSPDDRQVSLRVAPDARVCLHWRDEPGARLNVVEPIGRVLSDALECESEERSLVMVDSALNQGLLTPTKLAEIGRALPLRCRESIAKCDPRSESGTETLVRLRLRSLRINVGTQAYRDGVGRVDLLVGDRLVIECDSRSFHTAGDSYRRDRSRDLALVDGDFLVLRLTYEQIIYEWERVEAVILGIVRANRHLWPRHRV